MALNQAPAPAGRRPDQRPSAVASLLVAIAVLAAACTAAPTPTPSPTATPSIEPSAATSAAATPTPSTSIPGSIVAISCGAAAASGSVCLGDAASSIEATAAKGSNVTLSLAVKNPGGTGTTPVSVLIYVPAPGSLPFGAPVCTACNSISGKSVVGLEWPALAPGETRTLSVQLPVTGAIGKAAWSATLYAKPLADVLADEIANGLQAGQQTWAVALTITAP